ncbi:hypothetical protein NDN08_000639 [Rhodosorus marinus]|uniref:sn-1-specific diacylglycerol lipase n=1 Tax=Rhodosorus marinus TaxID=101924 RepID=A0AAV8URM5_9RHOD|nr:hypothetical protein NDN08_000639 [Rhodosorus marinus]
MSLTKGTAESVMDEALTDSDVESEDSVLRSGVFNCKAGNIPEEARCYWDNLAEQLSDDGSCTSGPSTLLDEWSSTFGKNNTVSAEDAIHFDGELSRCSSLVTNAESELEQSVSQGDEDFISQFEKDLIARKEEEREDELAQASLKGDLKRLMSVCCPRPDAERKRALDEVAMIANRVGAEELSLMSILRGIQVAKNFPEVSRTRNEEHEILGRGTQAPSGCAQPSPTDVEELERTNKLSSHALASYGGALEFMKTKDIYECSEEELAAEEQKIRGQLDPSSGNFTLVSGESGPCKPRYYVAVDHSIKSIVLSVKGTSNIDDVMTDLSPDLHPVVARAPPSHGECESTLKRPFVVGGVHRGFYQSAKHIVSGSRNELLRLSEEHPGYDIFLTGHSLGASAASLATILLYKDEDYVNRANRTRCVAFGPAPCVTEAIGEVFNEVITSYINNDDVVSAMEIHTAAQFVEMCKEIEKLPLLTRLAINFGFTRLVSGQIKKIRTCDVDRLQMRVYSAGTVFHIRSKEGCDRVTYRNMQKLQAQPKECSDPQRVQYHQEELRRVADSIEVVPARRQGFQDVTFSANAWLDHQPSNYVNIFGFLLAARRAEIEAYCCTKDHLDELSTPAWVG